MKKSFALCLVAASAAFSAQADRYWSGSSADALWSDTDNWSTTSGGATGVTIPGDGTGSTFFRNYLNGSVSIDGAYTVPDVLRIDTKDERPFVWSATDSANGITSSSELRICRDGGKSPAYLQIDSGTYAFSYLRVGYAANAKAGLTVNGGEVSFTKVRIADESGVDGFLKICGGTVTVQSEFYASDISGTTSLVEIDGGTLDTTQMDFVRIGRSSDSTATFHVKSGTWNTQSFLVGGKTKNSTSDNSYANVTAQLIVDGGNVNASGDCNVGANNGDNCVSRLVMNGGSLFINANCLYVGDSGPGELVMNGGTLQMKSTDQYGITIGHKKSGKDVGTVTLNGGTLITPKFRLDYVQPGSVINFNGGTLKATRSTSSYINATANLLCNIQTGGLIIDTDGHDITIAHDLVGVGGIVKKGAGKLTLTGTNAYAGGISFDGENSGSVVEDDVTYTASNPKPAAGEAAGLDVSAGGLVAANVVVHGEPLESWLKDSDFTTYSSKYGAQGRATLELPTSFTVHNGAEEKTYTNLKTGTTYTDTLGGTEFSFTTEALAPRTLQLDRPAGGTVHNVRDVGSWPLVGGRKMNQNVILRGGHLDAYVSASAEQRAANWLTTAFGLKTEIDLRTPGLDGEMPDAVKNLANGDASYSATNAKYYRFPLGWGESDGTQIGADANGNFTNQVHNFFSTLGTEGRLPAYFHCRIGTDRTGIMGMLLLAVMGVEEEVLYRDYLMSNFADIGGSRDPSIPRNFLRYLHRGNCNGGKYVYDNNNYGLSVAARARAYLEMCGVTEEELGRITAALSGETPDEVLARVNTYEQANGCRTVSYVNYVGSSTTNEVHRLPAGTNMMPASDPTRSGYTFKGWDTANEVDNGDGTATVYAIWEENLTPFTYQWDNAADNNVFSDGANWKRKDSDPVVHAKPTAIDNAEVTKNSTHPVLSTGEELEVAELYFGGDSSTHYPVLDIEGGKLKVNKVTNLGRYGNRSEVNFRSGEFETKGLIIGNWGSHEHNVFNMYGGTLIAAQRSGWPSDAITLGLQTESKGILNVYGGEVYAQANVHVSFAGMESNIMGNKSVLNVDGGLMSVTGSVIVATDAKHACGQVLVKKGRLEATGDLNICNTSNSWGEVEISGGEVAIGGTIRVGNHEHAQHAVLKVAGGTLEAGSVSVARQCSATLYITDGGTVLSRKKISLGSNTAGRLVVGGTGVFTDATEGTDYMCFGGSDSLIRLNAGGTLETRAILRDNDANGTVEFNGGKIVKTGDHPWYGGKLLDEHHTLSILEGGMVFDTETFDAKYAGTVLCNEGCGGVTKLGTGKLTLVPGSGYSCQWNGPISVEEGTLDLSAVTFPAFVDVIRVAEGATLILPGDVTCRVLENEGTITGGTATVEANAADKVATRARWTGAAEDGDIRNNKNYIVYDQNGRVIYEQEITDNLRVEATCGSEVPDFEGLVVHWLVSEDILAEGYSVPSVIRQAAVWYDPDDAQSVLTNDDGYVTGFVNKGVAGELLNLEQSGGNSHLVEVVQSSDFNGRSVLVMTNQSGFLSVNRATFSNDQDLAMFVVARKKAESGEFYPFNMSARPWDRDPGYWGMADYGRWFHANSNDKGLSWPGTVAQRENTCISYEVLRSHVVTAGVYGSNENYWADAGTYTLVDDEDESKNVYDNYIAYGRRYNYGDGTYGDIGEALLFDTTLSDEEIESVRAYLKAKWTGNSGHLVLGDRLIFTNNVVIDLGDRSREFVSVTGAGRFKDGDVKVTGTITLTVNEDGTIDPLVVDGELDITGATLEILNASKLPSSRAEITAISVGSVKGSFASVIGDRRVKVIYDEGEIRIRRDDGFAISVR